MDTPSKHVPIAVVGIGCEYPGAKNPVQLWETILTRRQQFRRMLDERMPLDAYHSPDRDAPDKTYGTRAAFLDGFEFDWASRRIPKSVYESTDIVHWLALEVALAAARDAGYQPGELPTHTGVIVGNTLTGEETRANTLRTRWPFVRRVMRRTLRDHGLSDEFITPALGDAKSRYKSVFPPVDEDTLAGGLSNTIAGRICNYLDAGGGGYTVDGACASSLIAVATAAERLSMGAIDLGVAGGVDVSLDTFELIGFAKAGALSADEMRVYDRRAAGFIPGEGSGFAVLKRLEDARRDGDRVYAVIHGWGISSDGRGGITAPKASGQQRAFEQAYAMADYSAHQLSFVEGHGTGTPVGDQAELLGIAGGIESCGTPDSRQCGVTSFKSIVGHTKAAAGIGGFLKATLAVNRRVIPPTAACDMPHRVFSREAACLYPVRRGTVCETSSVMRAGVSAAGFGGINCHVTVEGAPDAAPDLAPSLSERVLLASHQSSEVFVFGAAHWKALKQRVSAIRRQAAQLAVGEMSDLAAELGRRAPQNASVRLAVTAGRPADLCRRLDVVVDQWERWAASEGLQTEDDGAIWIAEGDGTPRVGFVFPGQGAQRVGMGYRVSQRFESARRMAACVADRVTDALYPQLDRLVDADERDEFQARLNQTELAQPAICLVSMMWTRWLARIGITPDVVAGHSLGELSAFCAAGAFDPQALLELAALRGQAMAADTDQAGAMASVRCSADRCRQLIEEVDDGVYVANINAPNQTVVSGHKDSVRQVIERAGKASIAATELPVSNAFHTPMVGPAATELRREAAVPRSASLDCPVISSTDGASFDPSDDLVAHFASQVLEAVDFVETLHAVADRADILVEVGPGRILSGLARRTLGDDIRCLCVESSPDEIDDFNHMLGALFAAGTNIDWQEVYAARHIRPYTSAQDRDFWTNPCERPFGAMTPVEEPGPSAGSSEPLTGALQANLAIAEATLADYLDRRGDFVADVIRADLRHDHDSEGPEESPSATPPRPTTAAHASDASDAAAPIPPRSSDRSPETSLEIIQALVASRTGFPIDQIHPEMLFLEDLNLDSIKVAELVGQAADRAGLSDQIDPGSFAAATIEEVADAFDAVGDPDRPRGGYPAGNSEVIFELICRRIADITGFPADSITADDHLLEDLNLDSIKTTELVADVLDRIDGDHPVDPAQFGPMAVGPLADTLAEATASPPTASVAPTDAVDQGFVHGHLRDVVGDVTGLPAESLDTTVRPEQLGLDTPKMQRVVRQLSHRFAIEARVDVEPLKLRSLGELAEIFERVIRQDRHADRPDAPAASTADESRWVRYFKTTWQHAPRTAAEPASRRTEDDWHRARVVVICDEIDSDRVDAVRARFHQLGAITDQTDFDGFDPTGRSVASHYIFILPSRPADGPPADTLDRAVGRLHQIGKIPRAHEVPRRRTTAAVVQFDGVDLGEDSAPVPSVETSCALAFGATIHHERGDLRVRVINVSSATDPRWWADQLPAEIQQPGGYSAVAFDSSKRRYIRDFEVLEPAVLQPRTHSLGADDVVIITGGAKGITAECALALAATTGASVALVGRTAHPDGADGAAHSAEVARTLARFKSRGLRFRYFSCDVTDPAGVTTLVARVSKQLGPITGLLHGAAINRPRSLADTTVEDAVDECRPKLVGGLCLLDALEDAPLAFIGAMTSVIGVVGMPGNAWYAFSNEALNVVLAQAADDHPSAAVHAWAYSVWDEVGMGVRLGAVEQLARQGTRAIPVDEGAQRFAELLTHTAGRPQTMITSRLGLDTFCTTPADPPADYRFIDDVQWYQRGVEAKVRTHLDLETDPYVRDHLYEGSYLWPAVFGMEAMVQAACLVLDWPEVSRLSLEDVELQRPVVVSADRGISIELAALRRETTSPGQPRRVDVQVRTERTGWDKVHFSATVVFGSDSPPEADLAAMTTELAERPRQAPYGPLLFQGPRFQTIGDVLALDSDHCVADIHRQSHPDGAPGDLVLGDPFFRDGLLQLCQMTIPRDICLPISIERLDLYDLNGQVDGQVRSQIHMHAHQSNGYRMSCTAVDPSGQQIAYFHNYQMRIMARQPEHPTAEDFFEGVSFAQASVRDGVQQACRHIDARPPAVVVFDDVPMHQRPRDQRHADQQNMLASLLDAAGESAADSARASIAWDGSGGPTVVGIDTSVHLSVSHDDQWCMMVAAPQRIGCDVVPIDNRRDWMKLIGPAHRDLFDHLQQAEPAHVAGSRIWAALEAAQKGFDDTDVSLSLVDHNRQIAIFAARSSGGQSETVATVAVDPKPARRRMVAITTGEAPAADPTAASRDPATPPPSTSADPGGGDGQNYGYDDDFVGYRVERPSDRAPLVFTQRFPVSYDDAANRDQSVHFSRYWQWMGKVREAALYPIRNDLRARLETRQYAMVTNMADTKFVDRAGLDDIIEGSLFLGPLKGPAKSTGDLYYRWRARDSRRSLRPVASGHMQFTWVEILGRNDVRPAPFPESVGQYFDKIAAPADFKPPGDTATQFNQSRFAPGQIIGRASSPLSGDIVADDEFRTDLTDSNGVGNLYFSNYAHWLGRARDRLMHQLAPQYYTNPEHVGGLFCRRCHIDHLHEAMPYETIRVTLRPVAVAERGLTLRARYDSLGESGSAPPRKLATAIHEAVWLEGPSSAEVAPAQLPTPLHKALSKALGADADRRDRSPVDG